MKKNNIFRIIFIALFVLIFIGLILNFKALIDMKNDKKVDIIEDGNNCTDEYYLCSSKEINNGEKVDYKVNDKDTYSFYIIDNSSETVTLIMDKNIGKSDWSSDNKNGPVNVLNKLLELTSSWTNVMDIMYFDYQDYGMINLYTSNPYDPSKSIEITPGGYDNFTVTEGSGFIKRSNGDTYNFNTKFKSRLLSYEEVDNLNYKKALPDWLISNLKDGEGYWLLSSSTKGDNTNTKAYSVVNDKGKVKVVSKSINTSMGIRPIIIVEKSVFSK